MSTDKDPHQEETKEKMTLHVLKTGNCTGMVRSLGKPDSQAVVAFQIAQGL